MNQTLFILLLVLVLESHGILVVDKPYVSRTANNLTLHENKTLDNFTKSEAIVEKLQTEPTTYSKHEDQDSNESSESVAENKVQRSSEDEEEQLDSEEEPEGPPDHVIPYSEHEEPRNVSTKPKYVGPGEWAKPSKNSDVPLDFVPTKLYAQVRKTHTVRRLPRRKAIENADSEEEKENAARLREVVRNSKVNTVYTEEGYEDSAYDHGGHIRDADYQEDYDRKLREQLHNRKKSGDDKDDEDDEDHDETDATERKKYTKIDPEGFKDYEDHEDYKTDSNVVNGRREAYPKVVAEKGIKRLQEDVEREVEDIEQGFESNNSDKDRSSTNEERSKESSEQKKKMKKRRRPVSSKKSKINPGENLEESQNMESYSTTMVPLETTTSKEDFANPSGSYNYFQQAEENPTTVSYSKLFWDYFKTRQIEPTTNLPSILSESTTISPNFLQSSSILGNANTLAPYSLYDEETTTLFPFVESAIFGARTFAPSQFLLDPEYIKNSNQNDKLSASKETNEGDSWRPIIPNERVTTTDTQFIGTYDDQGIPFSNFVKNLDSSEESNKNLDSSLFNPSLNILTNRKPRYKIAVRQKPKKSADYLTQKSEPQIVSSTPKVIPYHENYMKVLTHLKNQEKSKNRHPNGIQSNNFYLSANINNPDDLRRMRPPLPQETSDYSNFYPRRQTENIYSGSQKARQARKNHQPRQTRADSLKTVQRSATRNRNLIAPIDLLPPVPRLIDDFARTKETVDYLTENDSKQARNHLRPFQRTGSIEPIAGIRAKRRERRSTNDGNEEDVKGSRLSANNDATNRHEIERRTKNSPIERNSLLKANSSLQVELVPDTSAEKRNDEKKSRSDQGKESFPQGRVVERESHTDTNDSNPLKYNNDEWKRKDVVDEEGSIVGLRKNHEDLLNEPPKITDDVIQKEIDVRFNGKKEEEDEQEDTEDDVEVEVPDFDYVEEIPEDDNVDNEETTEPTMDLKKYPFYNNERIPTPSALRYAIDPERLPRKTLGGMEFYDSRDAYKHCEEVEPTLKVLPEKEEPLPERGPEENLPRLRGLGDKLDCFKSKYFDNNPFDNPLFLEKEIEDPSPPVELDTKQFASRIMMFPKQSDDYVIQKLSRKPENYRRPRKPSSNPVRLQKPTRVLYRTIPGSGRGKRPRVYRVKGVRVKYTNGSRRPQKVIKRPITSASDVWSLYTPYQSQVYEDVMGTIRNMANSYQVYEVTTAPTSDEVTVIGEIIDDSKMNVSGNSTIYNGNEKGNDSIIIVERPRKVDANIEGLIPPKYFNRHQSGYNRNRIPQRNKTRVQYWRKPPSGVRVNHRSKVRVYKRSIEEFSSMEKILSNSEERDDERMYDNYSNKTGSVVKNNTGFLGRSNSTASDTVSRVIDVKRKSKSPKTISNDNEGEKKEKSQKIIYTINDRIRYSKPKGEMTRFGKFVNETEVEEDKRRKEPRYNYIKRRRPLNTTSTTTETLSVPTEQINWTESSISTVTLINEDIKQSSKELAQDNKEIHFPREDITNENLNTSTKLDEQDQIARSNKQSSNKTKNGYAVYENVNEQEETTTEKSRPETSSEFFNLKTFLETDPPGYIEVSSEELKKSLLSNNNSSSDFKFDPDSTNVKESENKEVDDEDNTSFDHRSNEESSEKADVQTSIESSEEDDSKENDSEERSTFFKYETRPSSPAENFEDEKYADLGPRINKPAFHHPPFSYSRMLGSKGSSEEAEASEEKEEYVFPWYKDKEHERKKRRYRGKIKEYEYPWERRERLAREEKRKRKGLTESFHEDEDSEDTVLNHRKMYPRGKYRYWSRINRDASEENTSDAMGSSSEQRPVRKYSSKYSAKSAKLPIDKKKINAKSRSLEEISRSITKALESDSEEKKNGSYKNRAISRGIVPEDVTLEPIRRNKKKIKDSTADMINIEIKNSTNSSRSDLDDSEFQTTVLKTTAEMKNSTDRSNKKRRRPAKNVIANVEDTLKSVDDSNRSRRRLKSGSTTPSTTTSTVSTTSASRVVRRRNQKSVKDSKRIGEAVNRSNNGTNNGTETSKSKSRALGHRSNAVKGNTDEKKSPVSEISTQLDKSTKRRETLMENSDSTKDLNKSATEQENNLEHENVNKKSDVDDSKKIDGISKSIQKFPSVVSDEEFRFKDDRIESLSDFDKSDDSSDDEFGSISKTDAGFTPKNRAVQLSEQESREVMSSVSWISENYNF